ncbi:MAG: hypothetical protein ABIP29_01540 [Candidatus Eisenbacteria bacterium]
MSSAHAASDPAALALADRVVEAMGGRAAWERTNYVSFDFVSSRRDTVLSRRSLAWDKATDRIHLALKDQKGRAWEVWTDLAHEDGIVTLDGAMADSATRRQWLARAHAIWVNDTYWLLMPFKLRDPGVTLTDAGADSTGKGHVVELSFAGVGLTPGDRYRVHVDDATKLVTGWEMLLQGNKDGRWKAALWTGWKSVGDVKMAAKRHVPDDQVVITFENLKTARSAPAGAFGPLTGR